MAVNIAMVPERLCMQVTAPLMPRNCTLLRLLVVTIAVQFRLEPIPVHITFPAQ
jgi:hypothetical protein